MDSNKKKKVAAILGAIAFMDEEKKTSIQEESEKIEVVIPTVPTANISPWAIYGRSYSMNLRILWQSRIYK